MSSVSICEAITQLMSVAPKPEIERISLDEALGRTLAADLHARVDVPGTDVSAMDGYACRAADTEEATEARPKRLRIVGDAAAGAGYEPRLGPNEAVSISTGAALPEGSDAIALLEDAEQQESSVLLFRPATSKHVRRRGEALRSSNAYLFTGEVLGPVQVGAAAALGHAEVRVFRPPLVAIVVTGPELMPAGSRPQRGRVFDSNGPLLAALVRSFGGEPFLHPPVGDAEGDIERVLGAVLGADLVVTSGGASVGRHDAVRRLLEDEEASLRFRRIRVRPGGPAMLGGWMDRRVLALPGNPVAAALLGMVLLSAWCHAALGRRGNPPYWERLQAVATTAVRGSPNKTCLWLARTEVDGVGRVMVEVLTPQDSTRFAPLLRADALVVMPAGAGVEAGATVDVIRMPNSVPLAHRSGRPFA